MKTLVVLSAFSRDKRSYYRLLETAPKSWNVYILSNNDVAPNGNTERISENILKYLNTHDIASCTLLGYSLGGAFALTFASLYPQKVEKLILIDSIGANNPKNIISLCINNTRVQLGNAFIAKKLKTIYLLEILSIWRVLTHPIMYWRLTQYGAQTNFDKIAEQIKIPTVLLWGEKDKLLPISNAQRLHQLIKTSKVMILPGCDHEWILHWPEKFWNLLDKSSN
jgi:4,5:9,10-diseco-3-hydroxy-5,9,17-trioxoandrosta-1(10),2-diene-4-oate hydrolase